MQYQIYSSQENISLHQNNCVFLPMEWKASLS